MSAPQEIHDLVKKFKNDIERFKNRDLYNEAQVRGEFIDPFFEALGWKVRDSLQVVLEDKLKVKEGNKERSKHPDYGFRTGNDTRFYVEAKKPALDLKIEKSPAFQVRSYGWTKSLPISVLTDFEEFYIYDCRIPPVADDPPDIARLESYVYTDYVDRWDEIYALLSYEAVEGGALEAWVATKKPKGMLRVDDAFLNQMEDWREMLAKDIALHNPELNQRDLNISVQRTIDRIVFLRIAEARNIELPERLLRAVSPGKHVYEELKILFREADDKYNSGLFHFKDDKIRGEGDSLAEKITISNDPLQTIINSLYYPKSPYEFSVMPADILGQVYERFLGKVIEKTAGGSVNIELKPEVRKAGGVYYTPTYIVDYIVQNTVGKLLEGKTPKAVEKLRILDPACGSGSFLIGAYQYLLDWHLAYYLEKVRENPNSSYKSYLRPIPNDPAGGMALSIDEKRKILTNNVYGVDLDQSAVEVTKLSLLLKMLEVEATHNQQYALFSAGHHLLPDLNKNIKWGNSLIGSDFYDDKQMTMIPKEALNKIKVFDWDAPEKEGGFGEIIREGGFDAVIGNPPWGASFSDEQLEYLRIHHKHVIDRMIDSYIYFIDKSLKLIKSDARVGEIIPSTILNQVDTTSIRRILLDRGLSALVNLGKDIFTKKVLNTSTIFITKLSNEDDIDVKDLSSLALEQRRIALVEKSLIPWSKWVKMVKDDPHMTFFTGKVKETLILSSLRTTNQLVKNVIKDKIQRGVSPDVAVAHVVTDKIIEDKGLEHKLLKKSINGGSIKRYHSWESDQYIIYTTKRTNIRNYPKIEKHLNSFKHLNTCKEVTANKHHWWALHRPRKLEIFAAPKFIGLTTSKKIELIFDESENLVVTDAMYVFQIQDEYSPWSVMAILQSKLFLFLYRVANQGESRVIPQVKASKLYDLPFPNKDKLFQHTNELEILSKKMIDLHKQLAILSDEQIKATNMQISSTDRAIDRLVYQLYDLTQDEIDIVEGRA